MLNVQYTTVPVVTFPAPLTARGRLRFYRIRPDIQRPQSWICDECFDRVTEAKMKQHVEEHR